MCLVQTVPQMSAYSLGNSDSHEKSILPPCHSLPKFLQSSSHTHTTHLCNTLFIYLFIYTVNHCTYTPYIFTHHTLHFTLYTFHTSILSIYIYNFLYILFQPTKTIVLLLNSWSSYIYSWTLKRKKNICGS
ncbi:hypothetical protein J3Q64DRAFT_1764101 [Phycomyces blakesleeanus]|uniref:Uncharacterized protein n=2 Tax=Phycomyces blakesleeanus TaxID=4837 RepID=A0A162TMJ9_PHYB8|nr:hypothetical protein PHYBLDRAFT_183222 [Phycomyces blakesleeanus NRRL 1555(-)]OAD68333.1 hypothetical protein PHYBLDRAFT_183222 [Phycomyces blakesleeanus NRRL 1555(-)]|eukprot:XP_018286373.1 hypothetical protein PHYBLDRAFT_183222 [Phycomyces blakesleeanus NRRL 1555(-)]